MYQSVAQEVYCMTGVYSWTKSKGRIAFSLIAMSKTQTWVTLKTRPSDRQFPHSDVIMPTN